MAEPRCRYFGICGGCSMQDTGYGEQLLAKRLSLSRAVSFDDVKVFHGSPYGYRSRMDFCFLPNGIGFRRRNTWREFFEVEECPISNPHVNSLLSELRSFFSESDAFDPVTHAGTFRYAVVRAPEGDSSVSFVVNESSSRLGEAVDRAVLFAEVTSAKNVHIAYLLPETDASLSKRYRLLKGSETLCETILSHSFHYPVQGFFQNNPEVAKLIHTYCRRIFAGYNTSGAHLLDLYGGVGTFGILNSGYFESVTIVESDSESVACAKTNIRCNGISNTEAIVKDAKLLAEVELGSPLYVVTDPPRGGMHPKTIKRINELMPHVVVYVSCNLKQLEVDIPRFRRYYVRSAALFDMFPQTPHIEAVVELVLER